MRPTADAYFTAAGWAPGDLSIVGSSRHCWSRAAFDWPVRSPWVVQDGPDGGELALLDALAAEPLWRIGRVVIASGDHLFADAATDLAQRGIRVVAVCRPGTLSRRLRLAVHEVAFLPELPIDEAA